MAVALHIATKINHIFNKANNYILQHTPSKASHDSLTSMHTHNTPSPLQSATIEILYKSFKQQNRQFTPLYTQGNPDIRLY